MERVKAHLQIQIPQGMKSLEQKSPLNGKTLVYWTSQDDFGLLGFLVLTPKGVILA